MTTDCLVTHTYKYLAERNIKRKWQKNKVKQESKKRERLWNIDIRYQENKNYVSMKKTLNYNLYTQFHISLVSFPDSGMGDWSLGSDTSK